ncbi:MAG: glycosyltransferase family 87 protein [Syntrophobacteraceae bacterium]
MEDKPASANCLKTSSEPLLKLHVIGLSLLLVTFILFGAMVEFRGAFLKMRRTDIGPYLRAAWSVRTGGDMYKITDDRGWHYVYPPLLAILMTPLADPPHGEDRTGYLPYEVTVGLWYMITMALGVAGIEILARSVEDPFRNLAAGRGRRFSQRWWALRTFPLLILLPAIGEAQSRGQVNLLIAFFLCCVAASTLKGRRFRAGLWLSAAICVKVIPAILLVFPLWRRDWRMLSGSAVGLLAGLILVPLVVLGPARTASLYKSFYQETIIAGITGDPGGSRGAELTGINSSNSSSPMVVLHNLMYPDKNNRPNVAHTGVRAAHWTIAFVMMAITLLASGWKGRWYSGKVDATIAEVSFFCAFIPLMFVTSPVFHPHYVSMALPLVMVLLVILQERYSHGHIPPWWKSLFWFIAVSYLLASIDMGPFQYLRYFGLVLLSTVTLWAATLLAIKQTALLPLVYETPIPRSS